MFQRFALFFLLLFMHFMILKAQTTHVISAGEWLDFPWTGGLDACQFGEMDCDGDGQNDLIVFDRRGNRLLTFRNEGITGKVSYKFRPEYIAGFPSLFEWAVFADYDNDGFNDIFTYSPGWAGIKVFRHLGSYPPSFELVVSPYLTSLQGGGYVNIIATNADYPAIYDVDGDGDLDMLNFWALGTYIELHLNQSMEKYGHADSLDYKKTDFCWGHVAENEENNLLYLDSCLYNRLSAEGDDGTRHRGATMLMFDFDNNGLNDLLLADVDFPGLTLLNNHGSGMQALITSQDTSFPSYSTPVRLFSMPVAAMIDVNNDGKKDLLVSPFDPNPFVCENKNSIWLYLNEGTNDLPNFQLYSKQFLQNQTIDFGSGAYPTFTDINGDGLTDLVVGNYGSYLQSWYSANTLHSSYASSLALFLGEKSGDEYALRLVNSDFAALKQYGLKGLIPAFYDLNQDGKTDLLLGNESGKLMYLTHNQDDAWSLVTDNYLGIDIGAYSAPQLFDLDEDGIVDLVIGGQHGKIAWYKGFELGETLSFSFQNDFLGHVDVTDLSLSYDGFSVPWFFYDRNNNLRLLCGSEQGKLYLFDQIRGNLDGAFAPTNDWSALFETIHEMPDVGMRSAAAVTNNMQADKLMLFAGNFAGGLQLLNTTMAVAPGLSEKQTEMFRIYPNPAGNTVHVEALKSDNINYLLRLITMQGVVIEEFGFVNSTQIELTNLPVALYIVQISGNGSVVHSRFIKK